MPPEEPPDMPPEEPPDMPPEEPPDMPPEEPPDDPLSEPPLEPPDEPPDEPLSDPPLEPPPAEPPGMPPGMPPLEPPPPEIPPSPELPWTVTAQPLATSAASVTTATWHSLAILEFTRLNAFIASPPCHVGILTPKRMPASRNRPAGRFTACLDCGFAA